MTETHADYLKISDYMNRSITAITTENCCASCYLHQKEVSPNEVSLRLIERGYLPIEFGYCENL